MSKYSGKIPHLAEPRLRGAGSEWRQDHRVQDPLNPPGGGANVECEYTGSVGEHYKNTLVHISTGALMSPEEYECVGIALRAVRLCVNRSAYHVTRLQAARVTLRASHQASLVTSQRRLCRPCNAAHGLRAWRIPRKTRQRATFSQTDQSPVSLQRTYPPQKDSVPRTCTSNGTFSIHGSRAIKFERCRVGDRRRKMEKLED